VLLLSLSNELEKTKVVMLLFFLQTFLGKKVFPHAKKEADLQCKANLDREEGLCIRF
jgi:hypothetical protein